MQEISRTSGPVATFHKVWPSPGPATSSSGNHRCILQLLAGHTGQISAALMGKIGNLLWDGRSTLLRA